MPPLAGGIPARGTPWRASAAQQFELDIFVGVSAMEQGLEQLPLCYDEARKALEYSRRRPWRRHGAVLFTALDVTHSDYYYPLEAEQQLLQYVRAGDASKAQEVLGRIFTANFETKRVSAAAARSLLYQLAATLQRLANSDALAQGGGADFDEQLVEQVVNSSKHRLRPAAACPSISPGLPLPMKTAPKAKRKSWWSASRRTSTTARNRSSPTLPFFRKRSA